MPIEHACKLCGVSYRSALNLRKHIVRVHSSDKKEETKPRKVTFKRLLSIKVFNKPKKSRKLHYKSTNLSEGSNTKDGTKSQEAVRRNQSRVTCDICGKTFTSKNYLKLHRNLHTKEIVHRCDLCQKTFTFPSSLIQHKLIHTGDKNFHCSVCDKTFARKKSLNQHMRLHSGILPYKCGQCYRTFNTNAELKFHIVHHTGIYPLKCPVCEKGFRKNYFLKAHIAVCSKESLNNPEIRRKRKKKNSASFSCKFCKKVYKLEGNLNKHLSAHAGDYIFHCHVCDLGFMNQQNYDSHLRTHEKDHREMKSQRECDVCGKKFSKLYYLKEHYRIHSGDLRFECSYCGRKFNAKANMNNHIANIHTRDFRFKCTFCDRGFTKKYKYVDHLKEHNEEKDEVTSEEVSDLEKSDLIN